MNFGSVNFGSSLSVTSFATISGALSVLGAVDLRHSLSVEERVSLGSSVSIASFTRLDSSLSTSLACRLGRTFSSRGSASLGEALSLVGFESEDQHSLARPCLWLVSLVESSDSLVV